MNIATISYPPMKVVRDVNKLRVLISEKFDTGRSFDWEPHITIADKADIPCSKVDLAMQEIEKACKTKPIMVNTEGLGFLKIKNSPFENPYLIFIKVKVSKELQEFHDIIQEVVYRDFKKPGLKWNNYMPHITLAYRDLTKENFIKAKKFFQNKKVKTDYNFYVDNLHLMRMENGRIEEFKKFEIKEN